MPGPSRLLRWNLIITDIGFIVYWSISTLGILPAAWLYKDHDNPIMTAWNASFAPMDLMASVLGLSGLIAYRRQRPSWRPLILASSSLTFCAGLTAVSFWALRRDFELSWWLPNLYLAIWPVLTARQLLLTDK